MRKIGDVRTIDRTPITTIALREKKRGFSSEPQKQIHAVFAGYVLYPPRTMASPLNFNQTDS
jgi:hypothetical protein